MWWEAWGEPGWGSGAWSPWESPNRVASMRGHVLSAQREALREVVDARCECGLLYPRVTMEQESREGILRVMHGIHLDDVRRRATAPAVGMVK